MLHRIVIRAERDPFSLERRQGGGHQSVHLWYLRAKVSLWLVAVLERGISTTPAQRWMTLPLNSTHPINAPYLFFNASYIFYAPYEHILIPHPLICPFSQYSTLSTLLPLNTSLSQPPTFYHHAKVVFSVACEVWLDTSKSPTPFA